MQYEKNGEGNKRDAAWASGHLPVFGLRPGRPFIVYGKRFQRNNGGA